MSGIVWQVDVPGTHTVTVTHGLFGYEPDGSGAHWVPLTLTGRTFIAAVVVPPVVVEPALPLPLPPTGVTVVAPLLPAPVPGVLAVSPPLPTTELASLPGALLHALARPSTDRRNSVLLEVIDRHSGGKQRGEPRPALQVAHVPPRVDDEALRGDAATSPSARAWHVPERRPVLTCVRAEQRVEIGVDEPFP